MKPCPVLTFSSCAWSMLGETPSSTGSDVWRTILSHDRGIDPTWPHPWPSRARSWARTGAVAGPSRRSRRLDRGDGHIQRTGHPLALAGGDHGLGHHLRAAGGGTARAEEPAPDPAGDHDLGAGG